MKQILYYIQTKSDHAKEICIVKLTYEVEFLRYHLANDNLKKNHAHNHDQEQKWPKTWSLANTNTQEHKSI